MDPIDHLASLFKQFPGIGTRQAHRFAFFLLKKDESYVRDLADSALNLRRRVAECSDCHRYFIRRNSEGSCKLCSDTARDHTTLLIVEKDVDCDAIEGSGAYKGYYFILGGNLPVLGVNPEETIRIRELLSLLDKRAAQGLKEVIIGAAFTPESEHTADYVREKITHYLAEKNIALTSLGRGLSTGSELEYADRETLRFALQGRK